MVSGKELAQLWEIARVVSEMEPHVLQLETGLSMCEFCEYRHGDGASCLLEQGTQGHCDQYHTSDCVYLKARRLVAPDVVDDRPMPEFQQPSGAVPLAVLQELVDRLFAPESQI